MALVEEHLADCPHCREYLHQMRQTIAMTGALNDDDVDEMPADVRRASAPSLPQPDGLTAWPAASSSSFTVTAARGITGARRLRRVSSVPSASTPHAGTR